MSFTRTFDGYAPPAREGEDAKPFVRALIAEAAAGDGPYGLIETVELDPADDDPANPRTRTLTTEAAALDPAYYRVTWEDEDDVQAAGPVIYVAGASLAWAPSVQAVADHIPARTKEKGGKKRAGTFTANTWPTAVEVQRKINLAVQRVATAIGTDPCTGELREQARGAAALYAAMLVETGYFPEQTRNEGSTFKNLESLWKDAIKTLTEAVGEQCGGGGGDSVGDGREQMPSHGFDSLPLIGRSGPEW